jgi:tRNA (guanine-N7-)-methyltransferase
LPFYSPSYKIKNPTKTVYPILALMLRNIKSFVRRERRITRAQNYALETLWSKYGLNLIKCVLDFATLFKREAPVIFEIGFGVGTSLAAMAKQLPEYNFIGVEVHRPGVGALLLELEQQQITNVKIFCADAIEVLQQCIPNNSLNKILLFFPDPWPKRKHHKRRLVNSDFVKLIVQKLKTNGIFHVATDWEDYAQHVQKIMAQNSEFELIPKTEGAYLRPLTKFELRGQKLGHKISDLIFVKKACIDN